VGVIVHLLMLPASETARCTWWRRSSRLIRASQPCDSQSRQSAITYLIWNSQKKIHLTKDPFDKSENIAMF